MVVVIVVMYVASVVLPVWGFGRLLRRANRSLQFFTERAELAGHRGRTVSDHDDVDVVTDATVARNDILWDTCLVGTGLAFGAAASIWSLFLP